MADVHIVAKMGLSGRCINQGHNKVSGKFKGLATVAMVEYFRNQLLAGSMASTKFAVCLAALLAASLSTVQAKPSYVTFSADGNQLQPNSINNTGTVTGFVGRAESSAGTMGFVRQPDGTMAYFAADPSEDAINPTSINDNGEIAGTYIEAGAKKGFRRSADGTMETFTLPHDSGGDYPMAINSSGAIFGVVGEHSNVAGFVRKQSGRVTEFRSPAGLNYVSGANDIGACVGWGGGDGFIRDHDGTFTVFNVGAETHPTGINNAGWVAGYAVYSGEATSSFVRAPDGTVTLFNAPDDTGRTYALAISKRGHVVGLFSDDAGARGFVRNPNGKLISFNLPGSAVTEAVSVNDKGVATGWYMDQSNHSFGFIRYP